MHLIQTSTFGYINGEEIKKITITFPEKFAFSIINFGGIITEISIPDKNGKLGNVTLAFDTLPEYVNDTHYIGALIGRYANRINNGIFSLNSQVIQLSRNNLHHHLHGGLLGFHKVVWQIASIEETDNAVELTLQHTSMHNTEGYPGNLDVKAILLIDANGFSLTFEAVSDLDTIFNPTQHAYFNLSGDFNRNISDHLLCINADRIVEINAGGIPSGNLLEVNNTHFDLRIPSKLNKGFDNTWALNNLTEAIILMHPESGRRMRIQTSNPGVQVYTANFFDGTIKGSNNILLQKQHSVCLEPQFFPDSPNNPSFPNTTLKKGDLFRSVTKYFFDVQPSDA